MMGWDRSCDTVPGFFSTSWLSLKTMSAALADKLRVAKVAHNVNNTRCPLGSLFIRQNHGFGSFEGFFAGLPPCQPPILTLHVSNGTPITDHLLLWLAMQVCFAFLNWCKKSAHITHCTEIWLIWQLPVSQYLNSYSGGLTVGVQLEVTVCCTKTSSHPAVQWFRSSITT